MASSEALELRPRETSIVRPTLAEVSALVLGLVDPRVTAAGAMGFAFSEADGEEVAVSLEGTEDGIETIRVTGDEGRATPAAKLRFCKQVAEALDWQIHAPGQGRELDSCEGSVSLLNAWRRKAGLIRSGLMLLAAALVFVGVVLWHAGGRQQNVWLLVIGLAVGLYFALRAWGFLERLKSRGHPQR